MLSSLILKAVEELFAPAECWIMELEYSEVVMWLQTLCLKSYKKKQEPVQVFQIAGNLPTSMAKS